MEKVVVKGELEGTPLSFETGYLARQALASVKTTLGETVVLTIVVVGEPLPAPTFLPLQVEYMEKMYAGGLISGSRFVKRELRPSDSETLKARLIDHAVRSLFKEDFFNEIQVVSFVLSYDGKNDPGTAAIIGTSAALGLGGLPISGMLGSIKIGLIEGKPVFNLPDDKDEESAVILHLSATKTGIASLESESKQLPEDEFVNLMKEGFEKCQPLIRLQEEFVKKVGVKPYKYVPNQSLKKLADEFYPKVKDELLAKVFGREKTEMFDNLYEIERKLAVEYEGKATLDVIKASMEYVIKKIGREMILGDGKRPDGRKQDEVRPISVETGVLPRTHGSAIFNRGLTQCMSVVTLGSSRLEQMLQGIGGEGSKRYMHHYNMAGFSGGEIDRKMYFPSRRSIGHGQIGENALKAVLPPQEDFPYTIRVVSEILSSNGSTSMAATCASSMALMDAGVKLTAPVAGISVGLVYDDAKNYKLLADIQGVEDHAGDMDFKIAGTETGINAVQLDNKMGGVPVDVLAEAVHKSREIRLGILKKMAEEISEARPELSKYAPKITTIKIDPKKIGDLIGPGGKIIKSITELTGAEIDIEQDGTVCIAAIDDESRKKAEDMIHGLIDEAEIGKVYEGEIDRVEPYGIFVKVTDAIHGLVHVSEIADVYVPDLTSIVEPGEKVFAKAKAIDEMGKLSMTMKGVEGNDEFVKKVTEAAGSGGGRPSGGDGSFGSRPRTGGDRGGDRGGRGSYGSRAPRRESGGYSGNRSGGRPSGYSGGRPGGRPDSRSGGRPGFGSRNDRSRGNYQGRGASGGSASRTDRPQYARKPFDEQVL